MTHLERILDWVKKNILTPRNDIRTNWQKAREECKAICKEIEELSEKRKASPDSSES
jgi:hypothetical protein